MNDYYNVTDLDLPGIARRFQRDAVARIPKGIDRIILFGSVAKGTSHPGSDIDLLIVTDKRTPELVDSLYDLVVDYSIELAVDISLKIYPADEFENSRSPFIYRIKKEGIELWKK